MRKVLNRRSSLGTFFKKSYGIGSSTNAFVSNYLGLNRRLCLNKLRAKNVRGIKKRVKPLLLNLELRESVIEAVRFLILIKSYRGIRHKNKYPARGQRTHTNAKTKRKFYY